MYDQTSSNIILLNNRINVSNKVYFQNYNNIYILFNLLQSPI